MPPWAVCIRESLSSAAVAAGVQEPHMLPSHQPIEQDLSTAVLNLLNLLQSSTKDNTNFYWSKLFYTRFKIWTYTRLWDHVPVALILGIEPYLPICNYGIILGTGHFLRYATTVLFCVQAIFSDLPTTVRCWVQPKLNWDLHSLLASRHRWHMAH